MLPNDTNAAPPLGFGSTVELGVARPERAEPAWAQQCRQCAHLRQQRGGKIWKCMALRIGHDPGWPAMGYCADARAPGGVCGPQGRAFVKTPNVGANLRP